MIFRTLYLVLAIAILGGSVKGDSGNGSFPPVDLGYVVHVPTTIGQSKTGMRYANYNNIHFAQPPLGPLRFKRPAPPLNQSGIQDGRVDSIFNTSCVSSVPREFPNPTLNDTAWGQEDCLFLNIRVPEGINPREKVPVLHWLYGSGYGFGSKDISGDSVGLYDQLYEPIQKFIHIASNYRYWVTKHLQLPGESLTRIIEWAYMAGRPLRIRTWMQTWACMML